MYPDLSPVHPWLTEGRGGHDLVGALGCGVPGSVLKHRSRVPTRAGANRCVRARDLVGLPPPHHTPPRRRCKHRLISPRVRSAYAWGWGCGRHICMTGAQPSTRARTASLSLSPSHARAHTLSRSIDRSLAPSPLRSFAPSPGVNGTAEAHAARNPVGIEGAGSFLFTHNVDLAANPERVLGLAGLGEGHKGRV